MTPDGIDVSSAQHPGGREIDWSQVAGSGVWFAAIKATGEHGYTNPYYRTDWEQSRDAGVAVRCAYHFIDGRDPQVQAQQFYGVVGPIGPGELVALDVETSPGVGEMPPEFVVPLLERIERLFGRTPLLYMGAYYTAAGDPRYDRFPLWLPSYGTNNPKTVRPYLIHQYGSTGRVPGVPGNVDVNRVIDRQSLEDLAAGEHLPTPLPLEGHSMLSYSTNRDGRMEGFRVTVYGSVQHSWQSDPNGPFGPWVNLTGPNNTLVAGITRGVASTVTKDGRIEVFAYAEDFAIWHCKQTTRGPWSNWERWA